MAIEALVWFLLPDGRIGEIAMADLSIFRANTLAHLLGARYFFRRVGFHRDDGWYDWACYAADITIDAWEGRKLEPFKIIRSPDSAPAEMLCRAKATMT